MRCARRRRERVLLSVIEVVKALGGVVRVEVGAKEGDLGSAWWNGIGDPLK